jgi:hypothetical protein
MAIAKGTAVRQVMPQPVAGTIDSFSVDQETGEVQYYVVWTDAEGNPQGRFFTESQIELA